MQGYIEAKDIDIRNVIEAFGVQARHRGYSMNKEARSRKYIDCIMAFDIETTTIDELEQSIMYVWQMQINGLSIVGRTWTELRSICLDMVSVLKENQYLVCFVHNLSFEFQWLSSVFEDSIRNVFCLDARKVLKFDVLDHIEFRCSYLHSNMSLEQYTKKMEVPDYKLKGDIFDYEKKRYPWTPLESFTDYEIRYILNDVKGLVQAIKKEMDAFGDDLYSFPLTSTGYARRDAKLVLKRYRKMVQSRLPKYQLLLEFRDSFRGGNTHANRYFTGYVLRRKDLHQIDISSSYPTQMINELYPMTAFKEVRNLDFDRIYGFIKTGLYAYLLKVRLTDLKLRDKFWGCPYVPKAKCYYIDKGRYDNGRVLEADDLVININDIDLKIILQEYDFNIEILKAWRSKYDYLPSEYRELIKGYYEKKTLLKGDDSQKVYYDKTKAQLNALYGMMCQNPLKPVIEYASGEFVKKEQSIEDLVNEFNKTAFLQYYWGCWVTSYARLQLEQGIRYITSHGGEFLYTDTDSIKYYGDVDIEPLNAPIRKKAEKNGAYADDMNGVRHYMGVWEYEDDMTEFTTLGAKKYGYRTLDGKLHLTIAGVNKVKGAEDMDADGGLDSFKIGYRFKSAGGNEVIYNDTDYGVAEVDGHLINIRKNIVIKPSFYTLGITNEYSELLYLIGENGH